MAETLKKYKEHFNILNCVKCRAKMTYYNAKCNEYKTNAKKLWQVINQTIGKTKHKGSIIPFISIQGIKRYDPKKIANAFGSFHANLGKDLANKITSGNTSIDDYIG